MRSSWALSAGPCQCLRYQTLIHLHRFPRGPERHGEEKAFVKTTSRAPMSRRRRLSRLQPADERGNKLELNNQVLRDLTKEFALDGEDCVSCPPLGSTELKFQSVAINEHMYHHSTNTFTR